MQHLVKLFAGGSPAIIHAVQAAPADGSISTIGMWAASRALHQAAAQATEPASASASASQDTSKVAAPSQPDGSNSTIGISAAGRALH